MLQKVIADKHCTDLALPVYINTGDSKEKQIFVKLEHRKEDNEQLVLLDEWTDVKRNYLEWTLGMKEEMSCQAATRYMEKQLFKCPDHFWHPL